MAFISEYFIEKFSIWTGAKAFETGKKWKKVIVNCNTLETNDKITKMKEKIVYGLSRFFFGATKTLQRVIINGFTIISPFYVTAIFKALKNGMHVLNVWTMRFVRIGNFTSIIPGAATAQTDLNGQTNSEDNANWIK